MAKKWSLYLVEDKRGASSICGLRCAHDWSLASIDELSEYPELEVYGQWPRSAKQKKWKPIGDFTEQEHRAFFNLILASVPRNGGCMLHLQAQDTLDATDRELAGEESAGVVMPPLDVQNPDQVDDDATSSSYFTPPDETESDAQTAEEKNDGKDDEIKESDAAEKCRFVA